MQKSIVKLFSISTQNSSIGSQQATIAAPKHTLNDRHQSECSNIKVLLQFFFNIGQIHPMNALREFYYSIFYIMLNTKYFLVTSSLQLLNARY